MKLAYKHIILMLLTGTLMLLLPGTYQQSNLVAQNQTELEMAQAAQKAAEKEATAKERKAAKKSTAIREEIQRYIGYEPLLYRYITLPYDLTINTNVQGPFIEVGFLYLIFLPALLLLGFDKRKYLSIITMFLLFGLLIIFYSFNPLILGGAETPEEIRAFLSGNSPEKGFWASIVGYLYLFGKEFPLLNNITADKDHFTYPVLIGLFAFVFLLIQERVKHKNITNRFLITFLMFYGFLFLVMTAGIVWYGYLFFAVTCILIITEVYKYRKAKDWTRKYVFYLCGFSTIVWLLMVIPFRINNHNKGLLTEKNAMFMYEQSMIEYQAKQKNRKEVTETFFKNATKAFDIINADLDAQIIKIGTPFNFFITKSDERVVEDNQLNKMNDFFALMPNKVSMAKALRDAGYRYLIVDLNTHTLDRTPEKTLVKKFEKLLHFIYQNPNVEFMATDRLLKYDVPGSPEKYKLDYGVYGDIHIPGTYAIYRLK